VLSAREPVLDQVALIRGDAADACCFVHLRAGLTDIPMSATGARRKPRVAFETPEIAACFAVPYGKILFAIRAFSKRGLWARALRTVTNKNRPDELIFRVCFLGESQELLARLLRHPLPELLECVQFRALLPIPFHGR